MTAIRAAVLDDERIIAADLARQLARRPGWMVAGTFLDPAGLRRYVDENSLDVCFLDIEVPGTGGLALAEELTAKQSDLLIVFVTAFHQYAASAFRLQAVDYLVKPVVPALLDEACARIEAHLARPRTRHHTRQEAAPLRKIAVRSQGRVDYVAIADVIAAHAAGNYVTLDTGGGEHLHRTTLASFAEALAGAGFIRTHRSHLVHPRCIVSAKTRGGEIVEVTLTNGATAPVSEAYRADVTAALDAALIDS